MQFVNRVPFYGAAILCLDEPNVQAIIPHVKRPVITYGVSEPGRPGDQRVKLNGLASEFRSPIAARIWEFSVCRRRREFTTCATPPRPQPSRSISNVPADLIRAGLAKFSGVGRRFEVKGVYAASR